MTRKAMMDKVIAKYGFESPVTIAFCVFAEEDKTTKDSTLEYMMNVLLTGKVEE